MLPALKAEGKRTEAQVARERCQAPQELGLFWAYGVHPVTLAHWKRQFLAREAEVFGGKEEIKAYEKRYLFSVSVTMPLGEAA